MNKLWLQLSVGFCVGLLPAAAQAQQAQGAADSSSAGDIVVTANKREQNLNTVGLTITAISASALQERKLTSLADVANAIPGLAFAPSNTGTPILTLRGVGFNESSLGVYPAVSLYVDQIPLPFPALGSHAAFDLQRVEVLKGPQGTLFGQNSTGGAINYIANKPTKTFEAGADVSYGRFNTLEGNAYISGPLSDNVRARIAGTGLRSDDWQRSVTRNDTNGHQRYYAGRATVDADVGNLKLEFTASGWKDQSQPQAQQLVGIRVQNWSAEREVYHSYLLNPTWSGGNPRIADWSTLVRDPGTIASSSSLPYSFYGDGEDPRAAWGTTNLDPSSDRGFYQLALRGDLSLGSLTLTSQTSYGKYNQRQNIDGDGMAQVSYDLQKNDGYISTFNQEFRLSNSSKSQFRWTLGANYEDSITFENQGLRYFDNTSFDSSLFYINYSGVTNRQKIRNIATFANLEYEANDHITFKGAARYTNSLNTNQLCSYTSPNGHVNKFFNFLGGLLNGVSSDFHNSNGVPTDSEGTPLALPFTPINPEGCYTLTEATDPHPFIPGQVFKGRLKEDNASWRLGVDYKVNPDMLIYANISRGYKAGSFPTLAAANFVALKPVTQETVTSYEFGLKAGFMDHRIQLNTAGFYMDYKNKQIRGRLADPVFGGLETLVNIPKSRIWGAEADVTIKATHDLTLTGAVTYLNSKIQKDPLAPYNFDVLGTALNGTTNTFVGAPLPFTPKWAGSINLDYRHELSGGLTPFFGVSANGHTKSDSQPNAERLKYLEGCKTTTGGGGVPAGTPVCSLMPGVTNPFALPGYVTVDARLGVEGRDGMWKVMVWGKNVFNKYYWTNVISSADSAARFAGMPATYGVTLSFKTK